MADQPHNCSHEVRLLPWQLERDPAKLLPEGTLKESNWNGWVQHFEFPGKPLKHYLLSAGPLWGILVEAPHEVQIAWFETKGEHSGLAREALKAIKTKLRKPLVAWDCGARDKYEGDDDHPLVFWGKMLDEGLVDRAVVSEERRGYVPYAAKKPVMDMD